jgi:hypothetical protein
MGGFTVLSKVLQLEFKIEPYGMIKNKMGGGRHGKMEETANFCPSSHIKLE